MASLERGRVPSPRPVAAREIPLVDRVDEMNALKDAVYRAVHGEGGLVLIHGEAGIGKTRLIRELGAYARSRGVQVLYGRCPALFRMDGVPPFVLWKEIIKDYLGECTPEQLNRVIGFYPAEVAKLVPEVGHKLRAFPQSFPISPEQEQNRLFEAVSQLIANISTEAPLLVVLDDLQWTDPSSILLLHYIARGAQKTSLLLLGAYRSTDVDEKHPLTPVLAELNRERLPQEIRLKRMSFTDISEMIKNILEQEDVREEFCRLIYDKTRGNPFFAEETVKSLKEEGVIFREENMWRIKEVTEVEFPRTVKSVIRARIGRLDDECQNILTLASFIGNDFTLEAICTLAGVEENKLLELMENLLKTGLIKERRVHGEGVCSFADVLVRDVVYEEVSLLKRKKLHGVVGNALERAYAKTIDDHLGELAHHFLESGEKDKALGYFLRAGERAAKVYASAEAASYFRSALVLLEGREDRLPEKGHVLDSLGVISSLIAEYRSAAGLLKEALVVWKRLGEKRRAADTLRRIAEISWGVDGSIERAVVYYDEALKILAAESDCVELVRLQLGLAGMYYQTGELAKTMTSAEKALELSKKIEQFDTMARSYSVLGATCLSKGEVRKACDYLEEALRISLDNNYPQYALNAYNNLGVSLPAEENERRLECAEKAYELAKKAGIIGSVSWQGSGLALMHSLAGDMKRALSLAEDSVALDRKTGDVFNLSFTNAVLGFVQGMLGEWDKSEQCFMQALAGSEKTHAYQAAWVSYAGLGMLYCEKEDYPKARGFFEKMYDVLGKAGAKMPPMFQMYYASAYALDLIELGELEKAANIIDLMYESARPMNDRGLIASADILRAAKFRAEKKWQEAIELFAASVQTFEALDWRKWMPHFFARIVLDQYARTYMERDQEGDKDKALSLLNQALEVFEKMGARKNLEKTEAKIALIETGKAILKPKPTKLVSTGHAQLDNLLVGGIVQTHAVVLTAPSCDERNMIVKSFLETGAKNDESSFYVTIDPGALKNFADEYESNFCLFVCNPQADAIVKDASNVVKLKGVENLTDISIALTSAIRQLSKPKKADKRICIDLVSDVLLQHHAVQTRKWLAGLIPQLRSEGFTALAVLDPRIHPPEELHAISGLFDGEISIFEKDSERFLKITRMSSQTYLEDEPSLKREQL